MSAEEETRAAERGGRRAPATRGCIALIGPRATGKTAVGRRLAELSGRHFYDLDEHLASWNAELQGLPADAAPTVGELLRTLGEERFRDLEERALAGLDQSCAVLGDRGVDCVMACGGGVLLREANRTLLAESWTVVYLRTPVEELRRRLERVEESRDRPPLRPGAASAAAEVEEVLAARESSYVSASDFIVECVSADVESVAQRVQELCPRRHRSPFLRPKLDRTP